MGFFSKKRSSDADRKQQAANEPFIADDQTIVRVAELMRMFNDAVGNNAMVRATAKGISSAAGLGSLEQMIREGASMHIPAEVLMYRPWKMLAAVALRASQNGDHILAARIFGFTSFWGTMNAPYITPADFDDLLLINSPPTIEAEIATVAFVSLLQLPAGQVIFASATESVTAAHLSYVAANVLIHAPEKGIPVDDVVLAAAKSAYG